MKERLGAIGLAAITALSSCTPQNSTTQLLSTCQATSERLRGTIDENAKLGEKEKKLAKDEQELALKVQAQMLGMTAKIASDANRICNGDFFYFQTMRGSTANYGAKGRHDGFITFRDVTEKDYTCIEEVVIAENVQLQEELPTCEAKMQTRNEQDGIAVECTY